MINFAKIVM